MVEGTAINGSSRLGCPAHVLSRRAGDETVLLNLDDEQYFGLDGVGDRLWQIVVAGDATVDSVVDALVSEFDVDRPTLERDLAALVWDLVVNGLLIVDGA